jgi:PAS domain S-box-containing protein
MGKDSTFSNSHRIVHENEFVILIESRLLRFEGKWRLDESDNQSPQPTSGLAPNYDYLLNIAHHNHLIHPGDIASLINVVGKCAPQKESDFHFRIIDAYGRVAFFHGIGKMIGQPANGSASSAGLMTNNRNAEEEVDRKLYRYTETAALTGSWKWNLRNSIISFSENVYSILGLDVAEKLCSWDDLVTYVHKNDRHKIGELTSIIHQSGKVSTIDFRVYRKSDNSLRYLSAKAEIFTTGDGEKYCIGAMHDVTAEMLGGLKMRESEELATKNQEEEQWKIQSQESLMKEAELVAQMGSYEVELPSMKTRFSENMYRLFGYKPYAFTPTVEFVDSISVGNDAEQVKTIIETAIASKKNYTYSRRINLPNGQLRYINSKGKVEFDIDGKPIRIIGIAQDITLQKLTELALHEKTGEHETSEEWVKGINELLSGVINAPNIKLIVFTARRNEDREIEDFEFRLVSNATREFYNGSDFTGNTFRSVFPEIFAEHFDKMVAVVTTGEMVSWEEHLQKDGFDNWFCVTDAKFQDGIVRVWEDITARKKSQAEQIETEVRLKATNDLLESVIQSDIVALSVLRPVTNNNGKTIDFEWVMANKLQKAIARGQNVVKRRYSEVFPASIENGTLDLMKKVWETGERAVDEFYYQDPNIRGWFRGVYARTRGLLIISAEDITSDKKASEKLRMEHNRLKVAEAIGRIGSFEWNARTNSIYWSDEMFRIHGLTPKSQEISFDKMFSFVHPADQTWVKDLIASGRDKVLSENIIFRIVIADRSTRVVNGRVQSFEDKSGRITHLTGTIQDITELRKSEEELLKNLKLLQQSEGVAAMGSWEFIIGESRFNWSEGMYRLFGLTAGEQVSPEVYLEFVVSEDRPLAEKIVQHISKDHQDFDEVIRIRIGEKIKTVKVQGTVMKDGNSEPVKVLGIGFDTTAVVESERSVKEQAHFINSIVETIPDMLTVMELASNRIEYSNKEAFLNQGFSDRELSAAVPQKRIEVIHPEDREMVKYFFERFQSLDDGVVNAVEYRAMNNVGVWQWFRARGKVFKRNEQGKPTHCVNVVQNINMQKVAEEKVKEQGHYIQRLVDTVPDTILIYDLNLRRLIYANREVLLLLGYTPDELQLLNENIFETCVHPNDHHKRLTVFQQLAEAQDNEVFDEVFEMVHRDGTIKSVKLRLTPFKRGTNKLVSQIVAVLHDISGLKKVEQENLQMKELLTRQAEDRYRQLFNSMDEGFGIIELINDEKGNAVDFRFLETNPAFEKLTDLADARGKTIRELRDGIEDYWFLMLGEVARTGQANRFVQKAEALDNRWYEVFAFPTGNADEKRIAILFNDISERRNSEIQLRELNKRLKESDRAKTDFFSNVSHEFRTPLTLLLSPLEDILRNGGHQLEKAETDKIQMAHRNALRLQRLVNTLLDFSRIEAGRADAIFQPTDIAKYTEDLASNFRSTIESAGLKFVVRCNDAHEPVYLNREMYEKIVFNLLSNAFKFTFRGTIEICIKPNKNHVQLIVRDTGTGISKENLPRIFERFTRIEGAKSRTYEGSGIGLSLVHELVMIHGGKLRVNSQEGEGSEFVIIIPPGKAHLDPRKVFESDTRLDSARMTSAYVQEMRGWVNVREINGDANTPATHGAPYSRDDNESTVIVADDNADMREYLNSLLSENFNVILVENGQKVMDLLGSGVEPQLILSDVMMPEMNGIVLLQKIKSDERYNRIPVILISARAGDESRIEGMEIGADDYLIKPFSARELQARVSARIEIASLRNTREKVLERVNEQLERKVFERTKDLQSSHDEIRHQKELLQNVLDAMPQLVWTADAFGNLIMFNDRWYQYTGFSEHLSKGKTYIESGLIHPSQLKEVQAKWQHSINEGIPYSNETLIKSKEGDYCWHLDLARPIKDKDGHIFMWVGALTNVHDQFVAEKHVEEQKNLLEVILNSSSNGIQVLDIVRDENTHKIADFEWRYYNPEVLKYFSEQNLMGKRFTHVYRECIEDGLFNKLKEVALRSEPTHFDHSFKFDEVDRRFNVSAVKLEDCIVMTWNDVTTLVQHGQELKYLNSELRHKNDELESMNEQLSTFAFVASHDLREPLRKISFFINGIRETDEAAFSEKSKGYFQKILLSLQRMNSMINDILKYSRANGGAEEKIEVDLNRVLILATNDLSETIKDRKAVISSNKLPAVRGIEIQLIQVFENLISNAIKFQKPGVTPEVDITGSIVDGSNVECNTVDPERKYVCIEVKDNGIGFDERYLPKIFQMFQRLHGVSEYPGTGMGLAICKKIIETHGGCLLATSHPGKGATFLCYFPA